MIKVISGALPGIDDKCSRYFTWRDFIECSDTWRKSRVANTPQQPESWQALSDLAQNLLDPITENLGKVTLTYGFCSQNLVQQMKGQRLQTAPALDQHASCELNRNSKPACPRLGAACDFYVENFQQRMHEAARWICQSLPFDRLYYYGRARPIHISYGPEHKRSVTLMKPRASGGYGPYGGTYRAEKAADILRDVKY